MRSLTTRIGVALVVAGSAASVLLTARGSTMTDLRVLSAVGMRQVMLRLGPEFEAASGYRLAMSYDSGAVIVKRLLGGDTADIVLLPRSGVEQLMARGRVAGDPVDLATSRVAVAVRRGARRPDVSSPAAFRRAMLEARSIACPDPALGGSSGIHIAQVFERLGISGAVRNKLVLSSSPADESAMPGSLVAMGKAEIAVHQMQELLAVPGVDVVAPLPADLQQTFVFAAAIMTGANDRRAAQAFIEFLRTPRSRSAIKAVGMEPIPR